MLARLVLASIEKRRVALAALILLLLCGIQAARTLSIDALPDLSTVRGDRS